jgi:hypothetical protein
VKMLSIHCHNDCCGNSLQMPVADIEHTPIVFCSQACLEGFMRLENGSQQFAPQETDKINKLVQDIVGESKRIQAEFENYRRVRQGYFDIFSGINLKEENYVRDWDFKRQVPK